MTLEDKIISSVNAYLDAFANKDLEAIIDLFADDCWIEDPVGTERKIGKDALREFYQLGIDMGAKGTLESEVRIAGKEAAFAFNMTVDTENGVFSTRPIDIMTFDEDGKIQTMRAFWGPTNQGME
jgi:steroid delta-isomerase